MELCAQVLSYIECGSVHFAKELACLLAHKALRLFGLALQRCFVLSVYRACVLLRCPLRVESGSLGEHPRLSVDGLPKLGLSPSSQALAPNWAANLVMHDMSALHLGCRVIREAHRQVALQRAARAKRFVLLHAVTASIVSFLAAQLSPLPFQQLRVPIQPTAVTPSKPAWLAVDVAVVQQ